MSDAMFPSTPSSPSLYEPHPVMQLLGTKAFAWATPLVMAAPACQAVVLYHACGCRAAAGAVFLCGAGGCAHAVTTLLVGGLPFACGAPDGRSAACCAEDPAAREFVRECDTGDRLRHFFALPGCASEKMDDILPLSLEPTCPTPGKRIQVLEEGVCVDETSANSSREPDMHDAPKAEAPTNKPEPIKVPGPDEELSKSEAHLGNIFADAVAVQDPLSPGRCSALGGGGHSAGEADVADMGRKGGSMPPMGHLAGDDNSPSTAGDSTPTTGRSVSSEFTATTAGTISSKIMGYAAGRVNMSELEFPKPTYAARAVAETGSDGMPEIVLSPGLGPGGDRFGGVQERYVNMGHEDCMEGLRQFREGIMRQKQMEESQRKKAGVVGKLWSYFTPKNSPGRS
ncbi:hypothetical protein GGR52DRAFT_590403 [Hypoxylon sp. FL1284]|nr:hypothetical protein GGR52DRAFT_590403 [Hypoxylon sp. FL1284]